MAEPDNLKAVLGWPASVNHSYGTLVKERRPAALVVLAHYVVALHCLTQAWWLRDLGRDIVMAVDSLFRRAGIEDWHKLLQWPLSKVQQPMEEIQNRSRVSSKVPLGTTDSTSRALGSFELAFEYITTIGFAEEQLSCRPLVL